jgi:hypothetical protein
MAVHKGVGHYGAPITLDQAKKVMAAAGGSGFALAKVRRAGLIGAKINFDLKSEATMFSKKDISATIRADVM